MHHEKNSPQRPAEKVTINVITMPFAKAMEMNSDDIRHTIAILFPKRRKGLVVIVRIDHHLPLRKKCMVELPPLDLDKYDARLDSVDQLPAGQPLIGYHGTLKEDLRVLAEKLAEVSAQEHLDGGFFPGYASSAKATYWTPLTDDLPPHMAHVRLIRNSPDNAVLFAEGAMVKSMSFAALVDHNFASTRIERVFKSAVLFIDRTTSNGRKVLIVTEKSLQLLDLLTGKTERVSTQPETPHEKTLAYFRGRECATMLVGCGAIKLDPFYFPMGA